MCQVTCNGMVLVLAMVCRYAWNCVPFSLHSPPLSSPILLLSLLPSLYSFHSLSLLFLHILPGNIPPVDRTG